MAMSLEARKAARERMALYWAKRRAEEAEAAKLMPDQAMAEMDAVRSARVDEINEKIRQEASLPVPVRVFTAIRSADTGELISTTEPAVAKPPMVRTSSREYRIIANSDGQMVCENGPCLCGKGKREWHPICCKP